MLPPEPDALFRALLIFVVLLCAPAAEGVEMNGYMEFDYNVSKTRSEDRTGVETRTTASDFLQRYSFTMRQELLPTLTFHGGYILDKDLRRSRSGDASSTETFVQMSPSADLVFKTPFFTSSVGYDEVMSKSVTEGGPSQIMYQEKVNASFALVRQEDLPSLNIFYDRSHAYDKYRAVTDVVSHQAILSSRYQVLRPLELRYGSTYTDTMDNRGGVESTSLLQSGRAAYGDSFLTNRVRIYGNYGLTAVQHRSRTGAAATGEIAELRFPFAGLSGAGALGTDTPTESPLLDTLAANSLLIDGNMNDSSGINIGYSALVTEPRNMGLDLGTATEVNSIFVWVNQMLPASISGSFTWDIYTSSDTADLKQWTLQQTVAPAVFGTFDRRFEIRFANVQARFIKVVTRPLASPVPVPGVDVNNILVTELQASIVTAAANLPRETTERSGMQRIEAGANVKLAQAPNLYYDVYFWQTRSEPQNQSRSTLVNSLTANHRLSRIFSTSAMASRSDSRESDSLHHTVHDYSASLTAMPLSTLNHTVRLSRHVDEVEERKSTSDYLYLSNNATLYRGITANLSLSEGRSTLDTGARTKSSTLSAGSTLVPHKTTTLNLYHNTSRYHVLSGDNEGAGFMTENDGASASYSPYETLYLYASFITARRGSFQTEGRSVTRTQHYSLNWSPLLSGSLWFSVAADEVITSTNGEKRSTISPMLRWTIAAHLSLEAGYQLVSTRSVLLRSRTETIFTTLRAAF